MIQLLKILPLFAALAAAPAFAAQPDPHHPDAQASVPTAAAAAPSDKTDTNHGCPMADGHTMAGGHMMAGQAHMSGAAGQHMGGGQMMSGAAGANCMDAKPATTHGKRHTHRHTAPKPSK